jgi:uncharacterized protein YbjT (DUF2867 family)
MKLVIIGGTGLIGSKLVARLREHGHEAVVVGTERFPDSPYLRAKNAQETLIKGAGIPYSIVHATQFFEFIKRIAESTRPPASMTVMNSQRSLWTRRRW